MACLKVFMYLLGLIFVSFYVQINEFHGSKCLPEKHTALFVFGDSLFDAGINNYINTTPRYRANFPPYGENFLRYPSGRFSNGRLIPDFIAEYANLPLIFPYLHPDAEQYYMYGVSFASAGAGALVETAQGYMVDLHKQVSYYKDVSNALRKNLGNEEAKALLSKAVHLLSVGTNDYIAFVSPNSSVSLGYSLGYSQQVVDIVIGNITTSIKEIYELGGRKFALLNVGPMGCFPIIRMTVEGNKCEEQLLEIVRLHNIQLPRMLQKLQKQLQGFKYYVFDFYSLTSQLMNYPTKYGFKEGEVACCGGGAYRGDYSCGGTRGIKEYEMCEDVNEYVYFDSAHPTEKAYRLFSNLMWSGNLTFNYPYNLNQLFEF